ncbi:TonB-dependent receptor plug domain-containing protein [Bradyrhizobium genosp. P]|uniref:TonB-dependent receptor plug domain-containing protein n=1 Tax=Bradyrhizobium genosp. P TaxID=83641 RepID=UPI003CF6D6C5
MKVMFATAALALASTECAAQVVSGATPEQDASQGTEDIIVTAQRRDQRLQDVPVAVSAMDVASLSAANIDTLEDLTAGIPGFVSTTATGHGQAPLSIRGVGGANVFADEPVAARAHGRLCPLRQPEEDKRRSRPHAGVN